MSLPTTDESQYITLRARYTLFTNLHERYLETESGFTFIGYKINMIGNFIA